MLTTKNLQKYALKSGYKIAIGHPGEWVSTANLIAGETKKRLFAYSIFSESQKAWLEPAIYFYSLSELKNHLDSIIFDK